MTLAKKNQFPNAIFNELAVIYDTVSEFPRAVAKQLITRITELNIQPTALLDLGCGTGHDLKILQKHYPNAHSIGVDRSGLMLKQAHQHQNKWLWWKNRKKNPQWVCADSQKLPFKQHQFDLIYANLSLSWAFNFNHTLLELQRVLKPQGLLLFTMLGPDTLKEVAKHAPKDDSRSEQALYPWALRDMHDIGNALQATKFTRIVMESERLNLQYAHFHQFRTEMQQLGFHTLFSDTHNITHPPSGFHPTSDSFFTTWEIIYGHAWGANPGSVQPQNSEISIPIPPPRRTRVKS